MSSSCAESASDDQWFLDVCDDNRGVRKFRNVRLPDLTLDGFEPGGAWLVTRLAELYMFAGADPDSAHTMYLSRYHIALGQI